jgi:hypothetical protein
MATLANLAVGEHDIGKLINRYGLEFFVETGLQKGSGVRKALEYPFEKVISIEIHSKWITAAKALQANPKVQLVHGSSFDMLPKVLASIEDGPTLWWLDAHLPERYSAAVGKFSKAEKAALEDADFTNRSEDENALSFPMKRELELITQHRDVSGDVFFLDDLHLYRRGWKPLKNYDDPGDESFIGAMLGATHRLERMASRNCTAALPKENVENV